MSVEWIEREGGGKGRREERIEGERESVNEQLRERESTKGGSNAGVRP
jgi:hypothetical protein